MEFLYFYSFFIYLFIYKTLTQVKASCAEDANNGYASNFDNYVFFIRPSIRVEQTQIDVNFQSTRIPWESYFSTAQISNGKPHCRVLVQLSRDFCVERGSGFFVQTSSSTTGEKERESDFDVLVELFFYTEKEL